MFFVTLLTVKRIFCVDLGFGGCLVMCGMVIWCFGVVLAGNVATTVFIPVALITCMVGLASVFAGSHHLRIWRTESLAAAAATSLIAWLLTLLSMGLAAKEIHTHYGRTRRMVSIPSHIALYSPNL